MRVLFLDLDTLRPDHLGCYGYHRDTSPNIDRIASEGVRFDNYYAPDAPCLPSRSALISGMHGIKNGAVGHGSTAADQRLQGPTRKFRTDFANNSLWSLFRKNGMYTCSISPFAERHSSFWFLQGLNEMHNPAGKGGNESAEEVTPTVMKWLDDHGTDDNWLLHINYWDPHTPYRAPEEFGNPFKDEPTPEWLTEDVLEEHKKLAGPHTARDNGMYTGHANPKFPRQINDVCDMDKLRDCFDGYDCGIRYMDGHIGQILDKLEVQGVLEDTAIIVTSDHGENFGELGIYSEHGTADNITCRIPMIVRWPGQKKGHVDTGLHYNFDLLPTICDMFDLPKWEEWDGQSYSTALTAGEECGRDGLVLSQCAHVCQRSARWDNWLFIKTYHDGLHPHFADEMLFDLENDPHETTNLAEAKPEIAAEGAKRILDWHGGMMASQPFGYTTDPLDTVMKEGGPSHATLFNKESGHYEEYFKRLEETGRGHWLPEMKRRHPEYF